MGLGPPVCLNCRVVMTLVGGRPPWRCACKTPKRTNLFCLTPKEVADLDVKRKVK